MNAIYSLIYVHVFRRLIAPFLRTPLSTNRFARFPLCCTSAVRVLCIPPTRSLAELKAIGNIKGVSSGREGEEKEKETREQLIDKTAMNIGKGTLWRICEKNIAVAVALRRMNTIISRYANVTNIKYIVEFREINGACLARLIQHSNDFAFPYVLPYIVAFVRWASFSLFISPFVSICLPFLLFSLSPSLFLSPFLFLSLPFYSFLLLPPPLTLYLSLSGT